MHTPNWIEKSNRLLVLLGHLVALAGQVLSLYFQFRK